MRTIQAQIAGAVLSVVMVAILSSCSDNVSPEEEARQEAVERVYDVERFLGWTSYVYDKRTGLCLLRSPTTHHKFVYVPVECTPEVMKLLLNPPE